MDDDESTTDEDDEGSGSDLEEPVNPDRARESILIAAAISNPSLFSINEKKSQAAQALCRSTGWSFEQILGWYRMFQSNVSGIQGLEPSLRSLTSLVILVFPLAAQEAKDD